MSWRRLRRYRPPSLLECHLSRGDLPGSPRGEAFWRGRCELGEVKLSLPLLEWIGSYRKEWLGPDVVAGLTTSAAVIPKAMAYATVAGLPIQVGLYTAFAPMIVYAVLGSSRVLSVSTSTTIVDDLSLLEDPPAPDHATALYDDP